MMSLERHMECMGLMSRGEMSGREFDEECKQADMQEWREGKKVKRTMVVDLNASHQAMSGRECNKYPKLGEVVVVVGRATKHGGIWIMENGVSFNKRFAKVVK